MVCFVMFFLITAAGLQHIFLEWGAALGSMAASLLPGTSASDGCRSWPFLQTLYRRWPVAILSLCGTSGMSSSLLLEIYEMALMSEVLFSRASLVLCWRTRLL